MSRWLSLLKHCEWEPGIQSVFNNETPWLAILSVVEGLFYRIHQARGRLEFPSGKYSRTDIGTQCLIHACGNRQELHKVNQNYHIVIITVA